MSEENENKTPAADEVPGRIKEILFSGELSHGQKLPGENKIAERLGVGRSSVREALKQLAAAGYVELVPNRGAFAVVTSSDEMPSPRDGAVRWLSVNRSSVDELLRVRSCIEPFAAELCAGRADKELCAALAENLSDFEKALRRGQSDKLSKLDYEFHRIFSERQTGIRLRRAGYALFGRCDPAYRNRDTQTRTPEGLRQTHRRSGGTSSDPERNLPSMGVPRGQHRVNRAGGSRRI